ncbi:hypothetical protein C0U40_09250 [Amylibacter cionae]|nr:hypothetical protein C0U40_09250 [Amylibacter cionae]
MENRLTQNTGLFRRAGHLEWAQIFDLWAEQMGFDGYMTVCHGNLIHIAADRIRLDGSVVGDSHDYRRSEAVFHENEVSEVSPCNRFEHSFGVTSDGFEIFALLRKGLHAPGIEIQTFPELLRLVRTAT